MFEFYMNDTRIVFSDTPPDRNQSSRLIFLPDELTGDYFTGLRKEIYADGHGYWLIHRNSAEAFSVFTSTFPQIEAAGGSVLDENSRLLMIFRFGRWDLPKGKLNPEEDPLAGAMREIEEECGIGPLKFIRQLPSTHHGYVYNGEEVMKNTRWYLFRYSGQTLPVPQTEEGIEKAAFMGPKEVIKAIKNSYPSLSAVLSQTLLAMKELSDQATDQS